MNRWTLAAVAAVAASMTLGCGTKTADCNSFIAAVNKNIEDMKKAEAGDPKALAGVIKKGNDTAKAVAIKDEGLKGLAKKYTDVWDNGAASLTALEAATDEAGIKKAKDGLDALEKSESAIVDEINKYCTN